MAFAEPLEVAWRQGGGGGVAQRVEPDRIMGHQVRIQNDLRDLSLFIIDQREGRHRAGRHPETVEKPVRLDEGEPSAGPERPADALEVDAEAAERDQKEQAVPVGHEQRLRMPAGKARLDRRALGDREHGLVLLGAMGDPHRVEGGVEIGFAVRHGHSPIGKGAFSPHGYPRGLERGIGEAAGTGEA